MTSTLSSHYNNNNNNNPFYQPPTHQKRRVLLKRATQQINDPKVIKQLSKMKKSVKFLPQDQLEQVRYFYKSHSPKTCRHDPPFMSSSIEDYKLSMPNWPTRNSIFYNTDQKVRMESVVLIDGDFEQMNNNQMVIEGKCRALNLNFHKLVSIRYTFDLWRTYQETTGEFKESIASTSNTWDRFSFHIPIDADRKTQSLYLALRYTVDDQEYWDNNNGINYEVIVTPEPSSVLEDLEKEQVVHVEHVTTEQETTTRTTTRTTTTTQEDEEELAMLKENTKVLGRRYDFSTSLTAAATAYRKPYFVSPPPSPPGTPIDTESFTYTPPIFFGGAASLETTSYAINPIPSSVPITTTTTTTTTTKKSDPIPINMTKVETPVSSAEGFQMSYSDFVNKYCFYNSHSNPIYSTLSTSPSAVLS